MDIKIKRLSNSSSGISTTMGRPLHYLRTRAWGQQKSRQNKKSIDRVPEIIHIGCRLRYEDLDGPSSWRKIDRHVLGALYTRPWMNCWENDRKTRTQSIISRPRLIERLMNASRERNELPALLVGKSRRPRF